MTGESGSLLGLVATVDWHTVTWIPGDMRAVDVRKTARALLADARECDRLERQLTAHWRETGDYHALALAGECKKRAPRMRFAARTLLNHLPASSR